MLFKMEIFNNKSHATFDVGAAFQLHPRFGLPQLVVKIATCHNISKGGNIDVCDLAP